MNSQTLFNNYIIAGVEASLARVRAAEYVVPEADRQQAWQILSFALKVDEAWPVTRELLLELAPKMEMAGFREEWIPYLEQGLYYAKCVGDGQVAAGCELQMGILYRLMSQYEEAHQLIQASVVQFVKQNHAVGQANALNELAWLAHLQHHYAAAEKYVEQAIALSTSDQQVLANARRIQGMIAIGNRQWTEAVDLHHQALTLFQQLDDKRKSAWSIQNIGYALNELGRLDEAESYLRQAIERLQMLNDSYHLAIAKMNLANVLVNQGNATPAHELFVAAQQVFETHGDRLNQARVQTNLGIVLLDLQVYSDSQARFRIAARLYEDLGDQIWHINALDGLVMALTSNRQYSDAIEIADKGLALLPNIYGTAYYENLLGKLTNHRNEAVRHGGHNCTISCDLH
ncbi:MAG: tetratricopeptide repeat protein [Caldilineaceae bacterium]|nr:tetratricopeptide repeat protein [Caldilineaceae bacterium]